jgi:hypothetical protein
MKDCVREAPQKDRGGKIPFMYRPTEKKTATQK